MYSNTQLKGKKLLILGGSKKMEVIVNKAKELGIFTIVVDKYSVQQSPAKLFADKHFSIDFSHYDEIKKLIQEEKIDGVMTGFSDNDLSKYLKICSDNNLPCYIDSHTLGIATDKNKFKAACIKSGVPVIPGIAAENYEQAEKFAEKTGYPLMVKPSDNSGSRGVIKCNSKDEFKKCYDYALSYSANGIVIVEKYMSCDNIAVSYFAADGEIRLSTTDDRKMYVSPVSGSSYSCYSEYPSIYTKRYIDEVNSSVIRMLEDNGFKNGMIIFQAFVDRNSFYFCEMCYRLSGGQHYRLVEMQNGIDQLALELEFAVTGKFAHNWEKDKETPYFPKNCAKLRVLGIPDKKIGKIEGFSEVALKQNVLKSYAEKQAGATVGKEGTLAQALGTIQYVFDSNGDRYAAAKELFDCLTITDEKGENIAWFTLGSNAAKK